MGRGEGRSRQRGQGMRHERRGESFFAPKRTVGLTPMRRATVSMPCASSPFVSGVSLSSAMQMPTERGACEGHGEGKGEDAGEGEAEGVGLINGNWRGARVRMRTRVMVRGSGRRRVRFR